MKRRDELTPDGITMFNGQKVYNIDSMLTVITSIHGDIASGFIINNDLTTKKCAIARGHGYFAHGDDVQSAVSALEAKILESLDIDEKMTKFKEEFKLGTKYPARKFYNWHHILTGSCEFGRNEFARTHGVDLDKSMTPEEFFALVNGFYGWENIKKAAESIGFDLAKLEK